MTVCVPPSWYSKEVEPWTVIIATITGTEWTKIILNCVRFFILAELYNSPLKQQLNWDSFASLFSKLTQGRFRMLQTGSLSEGHRLSCMSSIFRHFISTSNQMHIFTTDIARVGSHPSSRRNKCFC